MRGLDETRGVRFELTRHFFRRMFDGEWSSSPGQWKSPAVGFVSLLLPSALLLIREGALTPSYASKYRLLARAGDTAGIRAASTADEIALITLLLCVTGLIALLQWQALFPSRRDYLALAGLPVRSSQIFLARFLSALLFSAVVVSALNFLPSLIAPIEFGGGWQLGGNYWREAGAQAIASGLACFFIFFAILSLQGLLLNLLPPSLFARVSVYVQGALAGLFLLAGFYSWSIKEWSKQTIDRLPDFGAWLPPVWFAALRERALGTADPFLSACSQRALPAVAAAAALAAVTYFLCYRRYQKLLLEAPDRLSTSGLWRRGMLRLLARTPRCEAAMDFMAKTLARSRTHRLMWLVYLGAAVAVILNSSVIDGGIFARNQGWAKALKFLVLFWPLACSFVMISGFRHVLSVPAELPANWIFRLTEAEGRADWMRAVERFIVVNAIAPIYLVLTPIAFLTLGWTLALRMTVLQILISLCIFEILFYSWQKLPFTCSYTPGQRPIAALVGGYLAALCVVLPILSVVIAASSAIPFVFPIYLANFAGHYVWLRRRRGEGWGEARLLYEDLPSTVTDLGIRDITWARTESQVLRPAPEASRRLDTA